MIDLEMARHRSPVPLETRSEAIKKSAAVRSWISFDQTGQGTVLDLDNHAIMRRVNIRARDFRLLDPVISYPSTVLGREKVIVLSLEHIKAIITSEEVLLSDPFDSNMLPIVEMFQRYLSASFNGPGEEEEEDRGLESEDDDFPFEFRALEVALEAVCTFLDSRTKEAEVEVYPALDELTSKIRIHNLRHVRALKGTLTSLTIRLQKVMDELEKLADNNDDMANLYLSRKLVRTSAVGDSVASVVQKKNDVAVLEELEMLLEVYLMKIRRTMDKLKSMREYIDDTSDYINIQLDSRRNMLIQIELFLSSGNISLCIYSLVPTIFGMNNVPNTLNYNHDNIFLWVMITTGLVGALAFIFIILYARRRGLVG